MNKKKNQRRIPMNMKKIIPHTLAALSIAGALSACSDNKVVGADEQLNTVAVTLPLDATSAEKSAVIKAKMNEVSRPNRATAVFLTSAFTGDHGEQHVLVFDTVNAHRTYDNAMQTLINNDVIDTSYQNGNGWIRSMTVDGTYSDTYIKFGDVYTMQDENGALYGEIFVDEAAWGSRSQQKTIYCFNEVHWLTVDNELFQFDEHFQISIDKKYVEMQFETRDSLLTEQFIQDCAAENGQISNMAGATITINGVTQKAPVVKCSISREQYRYSNPYQNPYWKKYAAYVVNNCKSN